LNARDTLAVMTQAKISGEHTLVIVQRGLAPLTDHGIASLQNVVVGQYYWCVVDESNKPVMGKGLNGHDLEAHKKEAYSFASHFLSTHHDVRSLPLQDLHWNSD
jgi:hypothetical protein